MNLVEICAGDVGIYDACKDLCECRFLFPHMRPESS